MLTLPRKVIYSRNLRSLSKNFRSISSDQSQQVHATQSFNDSNSNGIEPKKEYGEKEIFLLSRTDVRTPLPGNTGVAPITVHFQGVPKAKCTKKESAIFPHSPEERHKYTLLQFALSAVDNIFSDESPLEFTIHECPQLLKKDFADLFPNIDLKNDKLCVLTLSQRTKNDMKLWSEAVEEERNCLEKSFIIAAKAMCSTIKESGYWANYIHPSSGQLALGSNNSKATMFETDLRYNYFGFTIEDLGCCKVISHREWGTHVFVGAIFTNAPLKDSEVHEIMAKYLIQ